MSLFFGLAAVAHAQPDAADTVLFARVGGALCQMVHVTGVPQAPNEWRVDINGKILQLKPEQALAFKGGWLVPIPAVTNPTSIRISGEGIDIQHTVKPQKKWTAYLTPHTHFDIGYTDIQPRVWDSVLNGLRSVLDYCDATDHYPQDSRYRWSIECTAIFEEFAKRYPEDMPRLLQRIREGRIEVCAMYLNLLTELCSGEELCRSLYPVARLREQYGITIDTAMHNDVPGITWQVPQMLADIGIRYLSFRGSGVRAKVIWDLPHAPTRPFLWQGRDGSEVFTWYTDDYAEGMSFTELHSDTPLQDFAKPDDQTPYDKMLAIIARQEAKGTPVDAIQIRMAKDNFSPSRNPCDWAKAWNERWAYPRIIISTNRMFFEDAERFRSRLETHSGDMTDWWADGAASAARETGMTRVSHERAISAETIATFAGGLSPDGYKALYHEMLFFDEHTWGAAAKIWASNPDDARLLWSIKSGHAHSADRMSRAALAEAMSALADRTRTESTSRLVVWNPSSWSRSGIVTVPLPSGRVVVDPDSGQPLPIQRIDDGCAVLVEDIPALGWRAYELRAGDAPGSLAEPPADTRLAVSYIHETGARRERVSPCAKKPEYEFTRTRAEVESESIEPGPLLTRRRVKLAGPAGGDAVSLEITSYPGGMSEIVAKIDKKPVWEVERAYLEFPFDLDKPTVRAGIPFAWMDPATDRLSFACGDYLSIDRAVDLNDGKRGVTFAAVEAPLAEFGRITTDEWSEDFNASQPTIYSYIVNNSWYTNYPPTQSGTCEFRYSIRTYEGEFDPVAAYRFGEETAKLLQAQIVKSGSPGRWADKDRWSALDVEPSNVVVAAVKPAEDGRGIILRLSECAGREAVAKLTTLGLGNCTIFRSTLLEQDIEELGPADGSVGIRIKPWQIVTIRLLPQAR